MWMTKEKANQLISFLISVMAEASGLERVTRTNRKGAAIQR